MFLGASHRLQVFITLTVALLSGCNNPFFSSRAKSRSDGASHGARSPGNPRSGLHGNDGSGFNSEVAGLFGKRGTLNMGPSRTDGKIVVTLPRDRCRAGTITFGNTKCQAAGRGLTRYSNPGDSRYIQGSHSNGRACWYLSPRYQKGATPAGIYTLGAVRAMGDDKRHWGQAGIRMNDSVPGRAGFVIHSVRGFTENTNAEVQNGYGCVRIPQECMTKLHQYRSNGGAGQVIEVNEI